MKSRFAKPKPLVVNVEDTELIRFELLDPARQMPLVGTPVCPDFDLTDWVSQKQEWLQAKLRDHGAILFRQTGISSQMAFNRYVERTSKSLSTYMERTTPRKQVEGQVYTSTEFPADQTIRQHNELSYSIHSPSTLWFYCETAAESGGETPLSDGRLVIAHIADDVVRRFEDKQWMLVRNFGDGFGPGWQEAFNTDSRAEVEAYCEQNQIQYEWKSEDRLRTRQVRPAVWRDPQTGAKVWCNHVAFYHISNLKPDLRKLFVEEFGVENIPFNSYYGDGEPIEDEVIEMLNTAYQRELVEFRWEEQDVLIVDNMLVAHGRNPFQGKRKILVAMGE